MDITIPVQFHEIVDEITRFSDLPQSVVEDRTWREAIDFGSNVRNDVARFEATPHQFNDRMEKLYRQGDGFIFETLVSWATPGRRKWIQQALERLRVFQAGAECPSPRILMLGDGAGNDSLFLAKHGFGVDYFDFPGSKTYQFAVKRFGHRQLLNDRIRLVTNYGDCLVGTYDAVICFEVLEHVPEPLKIIGDLRQILRLGGIALVTESFGAVRNDLPTHLKTNLRYEGRTPFVFLKNNMRLSWYSVDPPYKPLEFTRVPSVTAEMYLQLFEDRRVMADLMRGAVMPLVRSIRRWRSD